MQARAGLSGLVNTIKDYIAPFLTWLHLRPLRGRGRGHGPGSAQWRGRGWGDEGGAGRHHGRPRQHRRPGPAAGRQEARPQGGGQAAPWPGAGVHGLPDAEEPPAEALHRPGGVETLRLLHPVHHHGQLRLPGGLHTLPQRRQQRDERYSGESLSSPSSFYGHIALPVLCPPVPVKAGPRWFEGWLMVYNSTPAARFHLSKFEAVSAINLCMHWHCVPCPQYPAYIIIIIPPTLALLWIK